MILQSTIATIIYFRGNLKDNNAYQLKLSRIYVRTPSLRTENEVEYHLCCNCCMSGGADQQPDRVPGASLQPGREE